MRLSPSPSPPHPPPAHKETTDLHMFVFLLAEYKDHDLSPHSTKSLYRDSNLHSFSPSLEAIYFLRNSFFLVCICFSELARFPTCTLVSQLHIHPSFVHARYLRSLHLILRIERYLYCADAAHQRVISRNLVLVLLQTGNTPLNNASQNGHEAVVRLLLDAKVAIETANKVSFTALSMTFRIIALAWKDGP